MSQHTHFVRFMKGYSPAFFYYSIRGYWTWILFYYYKLVNWPTWKGFVCMNIKSGYLFISLSPPLSLFSAKSHHGWTKCTVEECETPFPCGAPLFFPDKREALLCTGLCKWRRGECPSALYHTRSRSTNTTGFGFYFQYKLGALFPVEISLRSPII